MIDIAESLQSSLAHGSLLAYPLAFAAGLLVSFTPCVYPIVPIQLGVVGAHVGADGERSRWRGFSLSLLFVLGMSLVYAALGAFAAATGTLFGIWSSSPWTYLVVGQIVLLMALAMLDVISIPTLGITNDVGASVKPGYVKAFLVGASSGLIVGPCTAPALAAILAYAATRGDVLFGGSVLFVFALGMGALMLALGTFGGLLTALPRSGPWMVKLKIAFGVAMLIFAEYLFVETGRRLV